MSAGTVWFGHLDLRAHARTGLLVAYAGVRGSGGVVATVDLAHPVDASDAETLVADGLPGHLHDLADHHPAMARPSSTAPPSQPWDSGPSMDIRCI